MKDAINVYMCEWGAFQIPPEVMRTVEFKRDGTPKKQHAERFNAWLETQIAPVKAEFLASCK